jgi:hypothetical protein
VKSEADDGEKGNIESSDPFGHAQGRLCSGQVSSKKYLIKKNTEGFSIDYWSGDFTFQISDFRLFLTGIVVLSRIKHRYPPIRLRSGQALRGHKFRFA